MYATGVEGVFVHKNQHSKTGRGSHSRPRPSPSWPSGAGPGGALAGGSCISYGVGLSAIRAAAARHALVLDDLAIKVMLGLDNAAKEHPAVHAGVGALALVAVVGYCREGIAGGRYPLDVHSCLLKWLWARAGEGGRPRPAQ